jgi:hypothetical protein
MSTCENGERVTASVSVEAAAPRLDLEPDALRARCRRAARRVGDAVVAKLGGGIVAFKFGRSWRVRFPPEWSTHTRDE